MREGGGKGPGRQGLLSRSAERSLNEYMLYCAAGPAAQFIYVAIFLGVVARGDRATVTSLAGRKLGRPGKHTATRGLLATRGGGDEARRVAGMHRCELLSGFAIARAGSRPILPS